MRSPIARMGRFFSIFALLGAVALAPSLAEAKMGFGGSRGSRTFTAPPVTKTAPTPAAPIQRTITPPPAAQPAGSLIPAPRGRESTPARPGLALAAA